MTAINEPTMENPISDKELKNIVDQMRVMNIFKKTESEKRYFVKKNARNKKAAKVARKSRKLNRKKNK